MDRGERATLTNMCMVYAGEKVLVINRRDPGFCGLCFPGGHVHRGEAFRDAVVREVYEETGLRIAAPKLCGIKQFSTEHTGRYLVLLYKTDQYEGELKASDEGDVFWLPLSQLADYPRTPDFDQVVELMLSDELCELYYDPSDSGPRPQLM